MSDDVYIKLIFSLLIIIELQDSLTKFIWEFKSIIKFIKLQMFIILVKNINKVVWVQD